MNKRDLTMSKYGITRDRYRELMYFCMQYPEWKSHIEYGLSGVSQDGQPHGNTVSNPVETQGMKNAEYAYKINMVDDAAAEADKFLQKYIIKAVTEGTSFEYLYAPCGRRQFYEARRKFFYILSKKR